MLDWRNWRRRASGASNQSADAEPSEALSAFELDDDLSVTGLEPAVSAGPAALEGPESPSQRLRRISGRYAPYRLAATTRRLRALWRASGIIATAALVITLIVAVAPHLPHPTPTPPRVPYTTLGASSDVARCLQAAAWSPDGHQIATVESSPCDAPYMAPGSIHPNLLIFAAQTGRQVASYQLDPAVDEALAQHGVNTDVGAIYDISYYEINWAPDGARVEIGFSVYGPLASANGVAVVTLAGAQHGQTRVLVDTSTSDYVQPNDSFDLTPTVRWDLQTGAHALIYLSPALAYRWLSSDELIATAPLPPNGDTPAPSAADVGAGDADGDPIGGRTFSMWQTATISPVTATACDQTGNISEPLSRPYAALTLDVSAWSPDGRYLLDATTQARLPTAPGRPASPPIGATPCDSGLAPDQLPSAPIHDNGMRAALKLLDAVGGNQLSLAWSPDGRRLAVIPLTFIDDATTLVVYDCASGQTIQRFTSAQFETQVEQYSTVQNPIWSPDGRSLLIAIDRPASKLIILGPQALGG